MEPTTLYVIGIVVCIAIIIIFLAVYKKSIKQGFSIPTRFTPYSTPGGTQQIGISAYPVSVDPTAYGPGSVWDYIPKNTQAVQSVTDLLKKWYTFANAVGPEISGAIYALFPDLQTVQSIDYYGVTDGMIRTLKAISPMIESPQSVKTWDDVQRTFAPIAVKLFSWDIGVKPINQNYDDAKEYDGYIDVY